MSKGKFINCEFCGKKVYKMPCMLRMYKHHFCSSKCLFSFKKEKYKTISKKFLEKEYLEKRKTLVMISESLGLSRHKVTDAIKKYGIKIRTNSESHQGIQECENNPAYIDGRTFKKHYCIEGCGNEISYNTWKGKNKRCCSCSAKAKKVILKGTTVKCEVCGKEIYKTPLLLKKVKHHFCSLKCFGENLSKKIKTKCSNCNKIIKVKLPKYNRNDKNFCSQECYHEFYSGENSYNWNGGSSFEIYPIEFNDELKESIRNRDNYICQNCGMTEEEHLMTVGRVLNIHHIDYNKQNCSGNNLIALCQQCNLRANANRDYWKEFYINKITLLKEIKNELRQ